MKRIYIYLLLLSTSLLQSQELLTLQQAVEITLSNNFDIQIVKNQYKIAQENNQIGNAGMLPRVTALVNNTNTLQNATLTQASGDQRDIDGARNFNISYGLALEWTVFDGFQMFHRKKLLAETEKLGETEVRIAVLQNVSAVMNQYNFIVNLSKQKKALDTIVQVSEFRWNTAKTRYEIGKASKLEVLNAEVDYLADQSNLMKMQEQIQLAKIRLNELMARDASIEFEIENEVELAENLQLSEILDMANNQNPTLQASYLRNKMQELQIKQIKGERLPNVAVRGGYDFVRSQSPFGFIVESEGRNLTYGFGISMNVFDGNQINRRVKTESILLENTKLEIERQKNILQSQIHQAYQSYLTNLGLWRLELKNEQIAKQNLDITLDKFTIGKIPAVDFRLAQQNYSNTILRLTEAHFLAKQSELFLLELAGNITVE